MTISTSKNRVAFGVASGIAIGGTALSMGAGIASADLASVCGGEDNVKRFESGASCQNTHRSLSIEFDGGLSSGIAAAVRSQGKGEAAGSKGAVIFRPPTLSQPIWNQPTIGGVGIGTSAGELDTADSQALFED